MHRITLADEGGGLGRAVAGSPVKVCAVFSNGLPQPAALRLFHEPPSADPQMAPIVT